MTQKQEKLVATLGIAWIIFCLLMYWAMLELCGPGSTVCQ